MKYCMGSLTALCGVAAFALLPVTVHGENNGTADAQSASQSALSGQAAAKRASGIGDRPSAAGQRFDGSLELHGATPLGSLAGGCTLYQTGFEQPEFNTGPVAGQAGWAANTPDGTPQVSSANPLDGAQHLRGTLVPGVAPGNLMLGFTPACAPGGPQTQVDVFISQTGGADYRIIPGVGTDTGLNVVTQMIFSFTGTVVVVDDLGAGAVGVDTGVAWPVGQWFTAGIEVSGSSIIYTINGSVIYTGNLPFPANSVVSRVVLGHDNFQAGEIGDFDNLAFGQGVFDTDLTGACCTGGGPDECTEGLLESECDAINGDFLGAGTTCDLCPQPVVCPLDGGPACPEDLTGDGQVNVFDLLQLLDAWGPCPGCPQDLNGNGQVDVFDLLQLLNAWGPCPAGDGGDGQQGFIGDPCGVNNDGGCNSPNQDEFSSISCGDTVCGTIFTSFDDENVAIRDTDWYEITITQDTQLEVSLHAEFASTFGILRLDEGCNNTTGQLTTSPAGVPATTSLCVSPGTYAIVVTTNGLFGDDLPCGIDNAYVLSLRCSSCEIVGACCLDDGMSCQDLSPAACAAAGGDYNGALLGPNVLCDEVTCAQPGESCGNPVTVVANGGPVSVNNANFSPLDVPNTCGSQFAPNDNPVTWFSFVGPGGVVEVKTCNSSFPTRMWLYCGDCASPSCFEALDGSDFNDLCGSPVEFAATLLCTEPGQVYHVAVAARAQVANPVGNVQLEVTTTPFPCQFPVIAPTCSVPNDVCADAINITSAINSATGVLGNNTFAMPFQGQGGDPNLPAGTPSCALFGPEAIHNTVWYSFTAPASGTAFLSLCDTPASSFNVDTGMNIYSGSCGSLVEVEGACGVDECGPNEFYSQICANNLTPGQTYFVVVYQQGEPGFSAPGQYRLQIFDQCLSNCCEAWGGQGCDDPVCEATICAADPFCCDTAWDAICAGDAQEVCEICGGEGELQTGACCFNNGESCAQTTPVACGFDPFNGEFFGIGTTCAEVDCGDDPGGDLECGATGAGNCCVGNGTPYCNDADCCEAVCAGDPFCCDVEWDNFCATTGFDDDCLLGPGNCGAQNTPECDC